MKKEPGISANDIIQKAELENDELILDTIFGVTPITDTTAVALEKIFAVPASLWINLQRNYDRDLAAYEDALRNDPTLTDEDEA